MNRIRIIFCAILLSFFSEGFSQTNDTKEAEADTMVNLTGIHLKSDSCRNAYLITASFAYEFPAGDMAKRFKSNGSIGGGLYYKTTANLLFGTEAHFIFGGSPKEDNILDSIKTGKTSDGAIIDANGQFATIKMYERGYDFSVKAGKIFPFGEMNKNSGIFATFGIGFLQHKIRIESIGNRSPQLSKSYTQGYDRLSNGIAFTENVGLFSLGEKKFYNFYGALEMMQAFTQGRRYNFDTMKLDNSKRTDLLFGLRIGWMFPVHKREAQEFYFN